MSELKEKFKIRLNELIYETTGYKHDDCDAPVEMDIDALCVFAEKVHDLSQQEQKQKVEALIEKYEQLRQSACGTDQFEILHTCEHILTDLKKLIE